MWLLAAALLSWSGQARATPVGTIFSGPTSADGATVYWNPAGMTRMEGTHLMLFGGATVIQLQYQRSTPNDFDGSTYPEANIALPKPNFALGLVTDLGLSDVDVLRDFRLGFAVMAPILEGASWDDEYDGSPSSTRHYSTFSYQALLYLELALAYRINRYISVSAGMDVIGALLVNNMSIDFGAKVNQMICALASSSNCDANTPLRRENPAYDGTVSVDGTGWGAGGVFAVQLSLPPLLRAGVALHTGGGTIHVPIDISVEIPPELQKQMKQKVPSITLPPLHAVAEAEVASPMIVTAGIAVLPMPGLEVSLDMQWIDYSTTTEMLVHIANTTTGLIGDQVLVKTKLDGYIFGLRGVYQVLDNLKVALRMELSTNTRPEAFVTPTSMDFHIVAVQIGAGWQATSWLALTFEYGHYFLISREIDESHFGPRADPTTALEEGFDKPSPLGDYSGMADSLSIGFLVDF